MQKEAKAFAKNEQTITIYRDAEAQRSRAMQLVLAAGQGCERREKSHGRRYGQRRLGRNAGGSVRGGCGGADVIGCGPARRLHLPQSHLRAIRIHSVRRATASLASAIARLLWARVCLSTVSRRAEGKGGGAMSLVCFLGAGDGEWRMVRG